MSRLLGILRAASEFLVIELVARALYFGGILFLIGFVRQRIGRRRLLIPMYHHIAATDSPDSACLLAIQHGVPVQLFRQHLRILSWFGPLVTLDEAFEHLHEPKRRSRSVIAVTFDDGYLDTMTLALPALRDCSAKATLFPVVRTASGGRALWWDELADVLNRGRVNGDGLCGVLAKIDGCSPAPGDVGRVGPSAPRATMAAWLCERFVELNEKQREHALEALATHLGARPAAAFSADTYATWDDLRCAAADGCEIGGHTIDHPVLPFEDRATIQAQVSGSRAVLQQELGAGVRSFAYPNGRHDATVRAVTAAAGYRCAVTVRAGVNYTETDPYQLRRVPIHRERPFHLAFKLAFYGWVKRG